MSNIKKINSFFSFLPQTLTSIFILLLFTYNIYADLATIDGGVGGRIRVDGATWAWPGLPMRVGEGSSGELRSVIEFDLTKDIDFGDTINSVTIDFWVTQSGDPSAIQFDLIDMGGVFDSAQYDSACLNGYCNFSSGTPTVNVTSITLDPVVIQWALDNNGGIFGIRMVPSSTKAGDYWALTVPNVGYCELNINYTVGGGCPIPTITAMSPNPVCTGANVTLTGTGFLTSGGSVEVGGIAQTIDTWTTDTEIIFQAADAGTVTVINNCGESASYGTDLALSPLPTISGVSPSPACSGSSVTISGSGFMTTQGAGYVEVGGVAATIETWNADDSITITAPATGGDVQVFNDCGDGSEAFSTLNISAAPIIGGVTPSPACEGGSVTITGSGFMTSQGVGYVEVNSAAVTIETWNADNSITITAPATGGDVQVWNNCGDSSVAYTGLTISPPPDITGLSSTSVCEGASVTINGSGFMTAQGAGYVEVNSAAVTIETWNADNSITFTAPAVGGDVQVFNNCGDGSTLYSSLLVTGTPAISDFTPISGCPGEQITINGGDFGTVRGSGFVTVNGTAVESYDAWAESQIMVTIGAGTTGSGDVVVENDCGLNNNLGTFTVAPLPNVTGLNPANACEGADVIVQGSGFLTAQGAGYVNVNGIAVTVVTWNADNAITITAPATGGDVIVANNCGDSSTAFSTLAILGSPTLNTIAPTIGCDNTTMTLSGTSFGTVPGTVWVNGTEVASYDNWTDTEVIVTLTGGTTSGTVTITNSCGFGSAGPAYTVIPVPAISDFTPTIACANAQITINGNNFSTVQGSVTVNGLPVASIDTWNNTQITVTPDAATSGTGDVVVTSICGDSDTISSYTNIPAPNITGYTPNSGCAVTTMTLTGTGFGTETGPAVVWVGDAQATVNNWTATEIIVTTGAATATGDIIVTNECGLSHTTGPYTVIAAPSITSFSPTNSCPNTQITIDGTDFGSQQGSVTVNGTTASVDTWNNTQITATLGGATSGSGNVFVQNVCGDNDTLGTFIAIPTLNLAGITPTSGCEVSTITLTGAGFGLSETGPAGVWVNDVQATVNSWSDTEVIVTTVVGTSGTGNVDITNLCGLSDSLGTFTVAGIPAVSGIDPTNACVGASVTISGSGFLTSQGAGYVTVNAVGATIETWNADNSITITAPATGGQVKVFNNCLDSAIYDTLYITGTPDITGIIPASGCPITTMTLSGSGFGDERTGPAGVWVNGLAVASYVDWSESQVIVTTAVGTTTGDVSIINKCNVADPGPLPTYTVIGNPTIGSINPTNVCIGDNVTINGSGFLTSQGAGYAQVNGVAAEIVTWNDDAQITIRVTNTMTTGDITVYNNCLSSANYTQLYITETPTITGISPTSGCDNTTMTLTGTMFGDIQNANTEVLVNGTPATIDNWTDTEVIITLTGGTTSGNVNITNKCGLGHSFNGYTVAGIPSITSFGPTNACSGTTITIDGNNFLSPQGPNGSVSFNGIKAAPGDYVSWNDTQIQVQVPAGATTGPITITNNCLNVTNSVDDFIVPVVNITGFDPGQGVPTDNVTIYGSGFGLNEGIIEFWDNQPATVISWNDSQIVATVPAGATTGEISVTNTCGSWAMSTGSNFTILADVKIDITKSIQSVTIGGFATSPIPGATITYQIDYSNSSAIAANNMIIFDMIQANQKFNNTIFGGGGWTPQYSESGSPDQSYGSGDYANTPSGNPAIATYIRWIKASVIAGESGTFTYEVYVK